MYKSVIKMVMISLFLFIFGSASAELTENKDYIILKNHPLNPAVDSVKDKIEVIEFFSYGCSYCYKLEPQILAWLAEQPTNVSFKRIAIPRKGKWLSYARLFYALDMLSPAEQTRITPIIYAAIHEQKLNLDGDNELLDWAASQNVDRNLLENYYQSPDVTQQVEQAFDLAKSYELQYVPTIIVNGQYQIVLDSSNDYAGTKEKLTELVKMAQTNQN